MASFCTFPPTPYKNIKLMSLLQQGTQLLYFPLKFQKICFFPTPLKIFSCSYKSMTQTHMYEYNNNALIHWRQHIWTVNISILNQKQTTKLWKFFWQSVGQDEGKGFLPVVKITCVYNMTPVMCDNWWNQLMTNNKQAYLIFSIGNHIE